MSATPTTGLGFQNFFQATLTADITSSSTDIFLDAIPNSSEGFLVIDPTSTTNREVIFYNSKTALKVTCPSAADGRGQDDSTAVAHTTGTTVITASIAAYFEALQSGNSIATGAISGSKLSTDAITLGYAQITSNLSTTSATAVQATGLTATVTIPTGGRKVKIEAFAETLFCNGALNGYFEIWDGVVGSGTLIGRSQNFLASAADAKQASVIAVQTPAAGSKTYNVGFWRSAANTLSIEASATYPAFILVTLI